MTKSAEPLRERILHVAFMEFYRNGFQGGSLNAIVEKAQTTKGALFHHFDGKQALGYAVVDEVIAPLLVQRWLAPMEGSGSPLAALKRAFRQYIQEDIARGNHPLGCPLNNLAQEMSPLDEGFRARIGALYDRWRAAVAAALERGITAGTVREDVSSMHVAALVVASQMGIWGTGKSSQDEVLMVQAGEALCDYLDTLKAEPTSRSK